MKYLISMLLIVMLGISSSAKVYISGTVYDDAGSPLPGVNVVEKGTSNGTTTDFNGFYALEVEEKATLVFSFIGFTSREIKVGKKTKLDVSLSSDVETLSEVVVTSPAIFNRAKRESKAVSDMAVGYGMAVAYDYEEMNTEEYATIHENGFKKISDAPLSTFSIDVDAASYSNIRRFINNGQMPYKDAVRVEEMINYFNYDYKQPKGDDPFSINTSYMKAPWNEEHLLVQIGLQGKQIPTNNLPPSNLVFLIDVSGSMSSPNKLPLLKSAFKMLTNELREEDHVSIVVYAGAAGLVLEPTSGANKKAIHDALDRLQAGGSTAGGAGIQLAYKVAKEHFKAEGNNRVIIATDGDFNTGVSSNAEMERLIVEKRKDGVFLTVLGFGMGNYKDSKMEILADKGNGNYGYIDNIMEAKKVMINEFGGTLFTIAKDVKLQVEFNPAVVKGYRLIGYENRLLNNEDFNDDTKDAGELGSGHTVTALYEVIPVDVESKFLKDVDELKYQKTVQMNGNTDEILTVKFRYKRPDGVKSKLITRTLEKSDENANDQNLKWAASVAGFGMLLRDSEYKQEMDYNKVLSMAKSSIGGDEHGYRREFLSLVEIVSSLHNN